MSISSEDIENVKVLAKTFSLDPIIVIEWTVPFPRTGRGQTKRALIQYITTHGGINEFNSDVIFSFQNGRQLTNCLNGLPAWSYHDRTNPNVPDVGNCFRVTKVTERTAELEDYQRIFNI
ncbi:17556_t:CDS:2 [Rhizophagus irregularis]|nr:17556_t:CDS:2 [Rhizophagus irregularis]